MNSLADKYASKGIGSMFLYTHEAHPGEHYPRLTSMELKFKHARALRDVIGVTRPILADALDGACHRAYGSMPNMSWIFNRSGMPVYKGDWTDVASLEEAIKYLLDITESRRDGGRLAGFHVERLDFRVQDRAEFYKGLERNGPKAVREFDEAF